MHYGPQKKDRSPKKYLTLQIFLGSNQTTSLKMKTKISDEEIAEINKHLSKTKTILVIHTVYLLNFCNHPPTNPATEIINKINPLKKFQTNQINTYLNVLI